MYYLIFGSILACLWDIFVTDRISKGCAKAANYNCDKCKNWKCYVKFCENKRLNLHNEK